MKLRTQPDGCGHGFIIKSATIRMDGFFFLVWYSEIGLEEDGDGWTEPSYVYRFLYDP